MRTPDYTKPNHRDSRKPGLPVDEQPPGPGPVPVKVGFLRKLWAKLDGNKRNIGLAMQGLGYLTTLAHPAGWGLVIAGGFVSGVGLVHDVKKKHTTKKEEGKRDWVDILVELLNLFIKAMQKRR